jgi:hypothetical protein
MKNYIILLVLLTTTTILSAQQTGRMETDRPDQTESPFLTRKNYLQAEFGFNYERVDGLTQWVHPTALWKYGLNNRFEFRMITEMQTVQLQAGTTISRRRTGVLPIQLGGKVALTEEKGLRPKTSLIAHTSLPRWGATEFQTPKWAQNFRFVMQNTLSEKAAVGYNVGAEWDGFSNNPDWIYTLAPGYNIGKNGYAYMELYGSVRRGSSPQHSIAGGLAYYFTDDTKIDVSGSYGLTEAATDYYLAVGFSFRAPVKKK